MSTKPFRATPASTLRLTAVTGAGASPKLIGLAEGGGCQVRIRNRGAVDVAIEFGSKPVVQAVVPAAGAQGSQGLAPGAVEFQTLQDDQRFVSIAVASGTPDVEITVGNGG